MTSYSRLDVKKIKRPNKNNPQEESKFFIFFLNYSQKHRKVTFAPPV